MVTSQIFSNSFFALLKILALYTLPNSSFLCLAHGLRIPLEFFVQHLLYSFEKKKSKVSPIVVIIDAERPSKVPSNAISKHLSAKE